MKTIKFLIPLVILTLAVSLKVSSQQTEVLTLAEVMPEYPGGVDSLKKFMSENIEYPAEAKAEGIQGRVYASFTVNKEGKVTDPEVVKGVHKLLDDEALRVIKEMPAWKPGEQDGKLVNVRYTIPVVFMLGENSKTN